MSLDCKTSASPKMEDVTFKKKKKVREITSAVVTDLSQQMTNQSIKVYVGHLVSR